MQWLNTAKYAVVYNVVYTLIYTVLKSYQSSRKVVYMSTHQWGLLTGVVCGSRAGPAERRPTVVLSLICALLRMRAYA